MNTRTHHAVLKHVDDIGALDLHILDARGVERAEACAQLCLDEAEHLLLLHLVLDESLGGRQHDRAQLAADAHRFAQLDKLWKTK